MAGTYYWCCPLEVSLVHAQLYFRILVEPSASVIDELLAARREEAARELQDGGDGNRSVHALAKRLHLAVQHSDSQFTSLTSDRHCRNRLVHW